MHSMPTQHHAFASRADSAAQVAIPQFIHIIRSNVIVPGALLIISALGPSDSVSLASQ